MVYMCMYCDISWNVHTHWHMYMIHILQSMYMYVHGIYIYIQVYTCMHYFILVHTCFTVYTMYIHVWSIIVFYIHVYQSMYIRCSVYRLVQTVLRKHTLADSFLNLVKTLIYHLGFWFLFCPAGWPISRYWLLLHDTANKFLDSYRLIII